MTSFRSLPLISLNWRSGTAALAFLGDALYTNIDLVLCTSICVCLTEQGDEGLQNLDANSLLTLLEAVDQRGSDGRVELSKKVLASTDDGCKHLCRCAADLPRHIVVIGVIAIGEVLGQVNITLLPTSHS
jgi:hypothetical protein